MHVNELAIPGAFEFIPRIFDDERGQFFETFQAATLVAEIGHSLKVAQVNCSVSRRDVVRGIHFADVPPGQAKYVTCISGAIWDVVVDLRVGSPTFGQWQALQLDDLERRAVYLPEGVGHAFLALSESATVHYLCSTPFRPTSEHGIDPMDPTLAISWPLSRPAIVSDRDKAAPSFLAAKDQELLPTYQACQDYEAILRAMDGTA